MSFDLRAKNWDTEDRVTRAKEISEEIIRGLNLPKEISVMEFGCGTGLVSFNYKDIFDKITLIDSSQGMIDEVNQKIKSEDIKNQILYVHLTSSVLRQELMMGREILVRNLNNHVGATVITNIIFR